MRKLLLTTCAALMIVSPALAAKTVTLLPANLPNMSFACYRNVEQTGPSVKVQIVPHLARMFVGKARYTINNVSTDPDEMGDHWSLDYDPPMTYFPGGGHTTPSADDWVFYVPSLEDPMDVDRGTTLWCTKN